MGQEINLMSNYPKSARDTNQRLDEKTDEDRIIARHFGKDFFDGDRKTGYGGYTYNPKYWKNVIPVFQKQYNLTKNSKILDIGCAKGFMLYDFSRIIPGIEVNGIDISEYAINNAKTEVKDKLQVANAIKLPFEDNSFDLVISITTLHNLNEEDLKQALKEINRVTKENSFITLDAYRNEKEKSEMEAWNLTALTMKHTDDWKILFDEVGYVGDYYWFMP